MRTLFCFLWILAGMFFMRAEETAYWRTEQTAWRGERVNFAFPQEPSGDGFSVVLQNKNKETLPAEIFFAHLCRGDGGRMYFDVLKPVPAGKNAEFLFVSVNVPADAAVGKFDLKINGRSRGTLEVLPMTLPSPRDWSFHLDLWQHPEAVARWCGVPAWSDAHFEAMRPLMTRLAQAGQKVITASIIEEPWDHQTFDDWHSMVKWIRADDGSWTFDYSVFDKWTAFAESCGIDRQINCYTMLPWSKKLGFFDVRGNAGTLVLEPGTPEFKSVWTAFLLDFKKHLAETGRLEKTCIALDERPDAMAKAARDTLAAAAPEIPIAGAVDRPSREQDFAKDLSPGFSFTGDIRDFAETRRSRGKITTFYVCCSHAAPNTFTHSPAEQAHWMPLYAAASGLDGFLRWAYNSWTENPFADTKHRARQWPAGDCFLVYPPNFSTLRFEALRDGIEDFEKIRILRERLSPEDFAEFEKRLRSRFAFAGTAEILRRPFAGDVGFAREWIAEASKKCLSEKKSEGEKSGR